jgi:hypothetical protein
MPCAADIFDFMANDQQDRQTAFDGQDVSQFFDGHTLSLGNSNFLSHGQARLIAINKITASSQKLVVKVNQPIFFHNIEISLHKYIKLNDPYKPESYALVTLVEHKTNDDPKIIFQGWLIESSPSISTFENPVYELFIQS